MSEKEFWTPETPNNKAIEQLRGWHRHYNTRDGQARLGIPGHLQPGERAHWNLLEPLATLLKSDDPKLVPLAQAILNQNR